MIKTIVIWIGFSTLGFASAWFYQANRYELKLVQQTNEYAIAVSKANEEALLQVQHFQKAKDEAENKAKNRITVVNRSLIAANNELVGLRNQLEVASNSMSTASCDSIRNYTTTLNNVFGECSAALTDLARQADEHAIDALMLQEAWPIPKP